MSVVDEHAQLGAYALGALSSAEAADFERRHLATCAQCRYELGELTALRAALDEVPPEAFLDGPPEGGDLLLQRTLRRVRAEEPRRPRRTLAVAGAAVLVIAALGAGVLVGRQTAEPGSQVALPPSAATTTPVPGTRQVSATDASTGVSMTAAVIPKAGWVGVNVSVKGVKAGEKCLLQVISKNGQALTAGSWQVSAAWEKNGFTLDGSALVSPDDVSSVDIVTTDGQKLVSAQV